MRELTIPLEPLLLGLAGLVPFAGLSAAMAFAPASAPDDALRILVLYAAVILSFLGGVHWGLALRQAPGTSFTASVVPSLLAWAAAAFLEPKAALIVLGAGFAALLVYDIAVVRGRGAPVWYRPLRVGLTAIVMTSIALAVLSASP